jgi:hypothetical protein
MARLTFKAVNDALAKEYGPGAVELFKGNGYLYFSGSEASRWREGGIYGSNGLLSTYTLEGWLKEARSRFNQNA